MNENFNPEISKSNLNFYRSSMENANYSKRKSGLIFKSNTNYNNYNNFNNERIFNKINNEIFDIDEEKDNDEVVKNKTLNKMILNHLNKDSFTNKFSDKTLNKRRLRLELNLEDPKSYLSQKLIRDCKIYDNQDGNQNNNNNNINDLEKIAEGFEIFPTEKLTEKSTEYKVVTEIIENINLLPDNKYINSGKNVSNLSNDQENKLKKQKGSELPNGIDTQIINNFNILSSESDNINLKNSNNNEFNKLGSCNKVEPIHNKNNKDMLLMRNSSDDLIRRIKNNNNYKVENLIMQRQNHRNDKAQKNNDLADSVDSKDSLFETKVLKFNLKKNSNPPLKKNSNSPLKKNSNSPIKKKHSDNLMGNSKNDQKQDDAVIYNKITNNNKINYNLNPRYQIHQNYNLSIINRREKIIKYNNNENLQFNKHSISSLPEIISHSNKRKSTRKDSLIKNKRKELRSHNRNSIDFKNKLFEESKKIPEFSVINYENSNIILKNKLDYTRDEINFNYKRNFNKPSTRSGTIDLRNIFADSSFNNSSKNKKNQNHELNLKRKSSIGNNNNNLYKKYSSKNSTNDFTNKNNEDNEEKKETNENKNKENLRKNASKKLSQAGSEIINSAKPELNNNAFNNENKGFVLKNSIDKNHFKAQNHAVIKAIAEVQKENLEIIEKKINEYVDEYNKRFVDFSFKKKNEKFVVTGDYKENVKKMREEIIKINP